MQVIVDQLLTTYDKRGTGPVILLLHGWGDSRLTFEPLQGELSKKFQVISLDLPGFGQTQTPTSAWDLDKYAEFVDHFLKKLKINHVLGIIGHSNGGAIAIRGLGTQQLSADKLILLAASGVRAGQPIKKTFLKSLAKTGKVATFWLPPSHRQKLRKRLYGAVGSDMLTAPHMQETFKTIVRQDIQEEAKRLRQPALLIYGRSDTAVPIKTARLLAKLIPKAQLIEIPAAGHFLHQEAPSEILEHIREFLKA